MARGNIKGITIEFDGNTTKLDKAIKSIDKSTRSLDKELKNINTALKFNPTSVELWRQKQEVLTQKVEDTKKKLDILKQAQSQMDASGVDKTSAEYRDLQRDIIETESKVKSFEGELKKIGNVNLKAASEQIKQVGEQLESAGQALLPFSAAGAAVTGAIGGMAYKAGQAADDLNTLSKVTGIGTEDLQKYSLAADLVDVSVEDIAKANKKLTKSAYSAQQGSKAQAEAFEKLGVSITDSNGNLRDSEDIFQDTITALGKMSNETERDALAQQLLGKSAANLNPLIEDGGETYKMVADTMSKYNLDYVDQETLDKANEFNDSLDTMKLMGKAALGQVASQLAAHLAPALEKAVDLFGRFAEWISKLDPKVLTLIAAIGGVIAVLGPVLIFVGKVAMGISSIINLIGIIGPAIGGLAAGPLAIIVAAIAAVIAIGVLLYKNWDKIKEVAAAVGKKLTEIWENIKISIIASIANLRMSLIGTWTKIKQTVLSTVNSLKMGLSTAWTAITTAVKNTAKKWFELITWPYRKAWETIKGIVQKIKDFFPIKIGNFFKGIKLPHFNIEWSSVTVFGKTIDYPSGFDIEWYKKGGIFNGPSVIGVGEAGSEAVVPLDKFWDKLDNIAAASAAPVINIYPGPNQSAREIAKEVERVLVQQQKQRSNAYGNI